MSIKSPKTGFGRSTSVTLYDPFPAVKNINLRRPCDRGTPGFLPSTRDFMVLLVRVLRGMMSWKQRLLPSAKDCLASEINVLRAVGLCVSSLLFGTRGSLSTQDGNASVTARKFASGD